MICKNGFSPSIDDVRLIVSDYVKSNKIDSPFKSNLPGRKWMQRFMKLNNLSLKKATMIAKVWKDCTSNPFIIYDFYDRIQEIICENNFTAEDMEYGRDLRFAWIPRNHKQLYQRDPKLIRLLKRECYYCWCCECEWEGAGPSNYKPRTKFKQSWRGDKALSNTFYGVSAKGWMTSEIMLSWFKLFIELEKSDLC